LILSRSALLAAIASIGLAACTTTNGGERMTLAVARSLPADALARRVLGRDGASMREAHVQAYETFRPPHGLHSIAFASRPFSAGVPGLCEARLISVTYEPGDYESRQPDPPRIIQSRDALSVFAVLSEEAILQGASTAESDDLQCRRRVPVVGNGARRYFSGNLDGNTRFNAAQAAFAVKTFLRGRSGQVESCLTGNRPPVDQICTDPGRTLRSYGPVDVFHYVLAACEPPDRRLCVTASIALPSNDSLASNTLRVLIATNSEAADPSAPIEIRSVSMTVEQLIA
jgi:hypothetical protein